MANIINRLAPGETAALVIGTDEWSFGRLIGEVEKALPRDPAPVVNVGHWTASVIGNLGDNGVASVFIVWPTEARSVDVVTIKYDHMGASVWGHDPASATPAYAAAGVETAQTEMAQSHPTWSSRGAVELLDPIEDEALDDDAEWWVSRVAGQVLGLLYRRGGTAARLSASELSRNLSQWRRGHLDAALDRLQRDGRITVESYRRGQMSCRRIQLA
ncbi:hypothetical protein [Nocardia terpenica]|uniref:hypothetical protein n=1 Tax=Nocardia terpenica TaxID=455432 RepID=UPI0012FE037B|nr:hypothetical protein [Nocardia terpenica]